MTSIFEGTKPSKTRPFQTKTRVIWVPGIYIYKLIYIYIQPHDPPYTWLVFFQRGEDV